MGQYYKFGIFKKNVCSKNDIKNKDNVLASFSSYDYNEGAKLMEHSYVGNKYVNKAERLLAREFYACPFAWVGDYSDKIKSDDGTLISVYNIITDVGAQRNGKGEMLSVWDKDYVPVYDLSYPIIKYKYVLNINRKEAVEIPEDSTDKYVIHPLPLLCADGNGNGGGDYYGTNMSYVGKWAYDKIGIRDDMPEGYTLLNVSFVEEEY